MSRPQELIERFAQRDGSIIALHVAFGLLGMATALPGAVLPLLATHWSLHDAAAGSLFAAQFAGGATGGLLVRRRFFATTGAGLVLLIVSAAGASAAGAASAIPLLFLYGLGHGLATTSISVMVGRRYVVRRGAALSLLNFSWSVGAAVCPLLMSRLLANRPVGFAFEVVALLLTAAAAIVLVTSRAAPTVQANVTSPVAKAAPALVAYFALLAFLYVGIESTMGGWISTFAERATMVDARHATAMASWFWGALLVGRALSSIVLLRVPERVAYVACLASATMGIALLPSAHSPIRVATSAVIVGLSLAPIFPLNLSLFLSRTGEFSRAGTMLAISGFGGAVLPWLTGIVSNRTGSLRAGLAVPTVAIVEMLILAMWACIGVKPIFAKQLRRTGHDAA